MKLLCLKTLEEKTSFLTLQLALYYDQGDMANYNDISHSMG